MSGVNNFITDLIDEMLDQKEPYIIIKPKDQNSYFVRGIDRSGEPTIDAAELMEDMDALDIDWLGSSKQEYLHQKDGDRTIYKLWMEVEMDEFTGKPVVAFIDLETLTKS